MTTLTGCLNSPPVTDARGTTLPATPSWWKTQDESKPKRGSDARSALAQTRLKLKAANKVIVRSKAWYLKIRETAAGK